LAQFRVKGWDHVFAALDLLSDADMSRQVTIRGESDSGKRAIHRQIAHYAYHRKQGLESTGRSGVFSSWKESARMAAQQVRYKTPERADALLPEGTAHTTAPDSSTEQRQVAPLDSEKVAALAHQFWQERGCPEGSPDEDWFRAEEEVRRSTASGE
jgi:hypothetical protein